MRPVDIIIPVYEGFEETINCLDSVLANRRSQEHVIVINDSSPNSELTALLRRRSGGGEFQLLENQVNLGFVATVNRGMALHRDRDVILLNSDTLVAGNWVERLQRHAATGRVGTVTPFSNNATICSFPNFCEDNQPLASVDEVDNAFSVSNPGKSAVIPTAVGFCMYINRECLDETGLFDVARFGLGYGEENDFCMRATALGWKHLVAADVYVAHSGAVSFSSRKQYRVKKAMRTLDHLYPDYHGKIQDFIRRDPLILFRLRAHASLLRVSVGKKLLLISHHLGGGVDKHLCELERELSEGGFFLKLTPTEDGEKYLLGLSVRSRQRFSFRLPSDYSDLLELCRFLGVGKVYVHHTMGMAPCLGELARDLGCPMDFMIHDYYLVNGNPTLTDESTRYCANSEDRDERCGRYYPIPDKTTNLQWRKKQRKFLQLCDRVIAPSKAAASLFNVYFPDITVKVIYHLDGLSGTYPVPSVRRRSSAGSRVLVLGALSKEKGADLLEKVAVLAAKKGERISFHLLGYAYRNPSTKNESPTFINDFFLLFAR